MDTNPPFGHLKPEVADEPTEREQHNRPREEHGDAHECPLLRREELAARSEDSDSTASATETRSN